MSNGKAGESGQHSLVERSMQRRMWLNIAIVACVILLGWGAFLIVFGPPIAVTFTNERRTPVKEVEFEIAGNIEHVGTVAPGESVTRRMRSVPNRGIHQARTGLQVAYIDDKGVRQDQNAEIYMQGPGYRGHIYVQYSDSEWVQVQDTIALPLSQYCIDTMIYQVKHFHERPPKRRGLL